MNRPVPGRLPAPGSAGLRWIVIVALVATAYFAAGRLGLLLAIPPGYATAVSPASGIALAAVLLLGRAALPGIALGSFLVNSPTGWSAADFLGSIGVPATIAAGAMLQAAAGAWLARRWVGYSNLLTQELDAIRILILGGPLACFISATIGVGILWFTGRVPADAVPFNWFTWWVGDSIGVLIFAALALIWSVRPYEKWIRRQLFVSVPLVGLLALVVFVFFYISQREQLRIKTEFSATAGQIARRLQDDLDNTLTVLTSIQGYYASTDKVERFQFEIFAGRLLPSLRAGRGLSWNPRIPDGQRRHFESRAGHGREIYEFLPDGQRVRAGKRPEYVPVSVVVARDAVEALLGFDVMSEPVRREALERARDTGKPVATRKLELILQPGRTGVLVFMPIYRNGFQPNSVEARRRHLQGYAVAIFEVDELLRRAARLAESSEDLALLLVDESEGGSAVMFEQDPARGAAPGGLAESSRFRFAGRQWRLDFRLPERELVARRSWQSWIVLAGGLMLTALAGMLMLLVTARSVRVESQVTERTAALRQSEAALQRKAQQLSASNAELEQFAYIASHDLKAPLRSIASFTQLIERRAGPELSGEAKEFLGFIRDGVNRMQALVDDLLRLSRVEAKRLEPGPVELDDVLAQASKALAADISTSGARLHIGKLPGLVGDERMLLQLFQNLIGNAIKFQIPGSTPEIWISAESGPTSITVTVRDNGIGVEQRFLDHIFQLFKRLHPPDQYPGTGLGLAICRKVVRLHGGEIRAESRPGQGLLVQFTLMRQLPA